MILFKIVNLKQNAESFDEFADEGSCGGDEQGDAGMIAIVPDFAGSGFKYIWIDEGAAGGVIYIEDDE